MLDEAPMSPESLRLTLQKEMAMFGDIPIKIVASPGTPIGRTMSDIARIGFMELTFTIMGETNAIAFSPCPDDIAGPPVYEINAIISPSGTFATTNPPTIVAERGRPDWGIRVFFRATPETTGRCLYNQMAEWKTNEAGLYWSDYIGSNQASQAIGAGTPQPER